MFERFLLDLEDLKPFRDSLFGFTRKQVRVKGYITLRITFGEQDQAKEIKVKYLVIDAPSLYNVIIWRPTFNQMGATLSTLYLCIKYPLLDGRVGFIQGDQEIAKRFYAESLK